GGGRARASRRAGGRARPRRRGGPRPHPARGAARDRGGEAARPPRAGDVARRGLPLDGQKERRAVRVRRGRRGGGGVRREAQAALGRRLAPPTAAWSRGSHLRAVPRSGSGRPGAGGAGFGPRTCAERKKAGDPVAFRRKHAAREGPMSRYASLIVALLTITLVPAHAQVPTALTGGKRA